MKKIQLSKAICILTVISFLSTNFVYATSETQSLRLPLSTRRADKTLDDKRETPADSLYGLLQLLIEKKEVDYAGKEFVVGERLGIIKREGNVIKLADEFSEITLEDLEDMQEAAEEIINKGLNRKTLNREDVDTLLLVRKAVRDSVLVEGLFFEPKIKFPQEDPNTGKIVPNLVKPTRTAEEVRGLLIKAQKEGIKLSIKGHLRGADLCGSSLDLRGFQKELTKVGVKGLTEYPSTPTMASDFTTEITFEAAEDPEAIEYIAEDYGITRENPLVIRGEAELDEYNQTDYRFAPAYIFANAFKLKGVRIICEKTEKLPKAGGMESSNVFTTSLIAAASMLSGANLNEADVFSAAVNLENDVFGTITGGQGHICCLLGGAYLHVWHSGVKNEKGEFINPYSCFSIPVFPLDENGMPDKEAVKLFEDNIVYVQAGKWYEDGAPPKGEGREAFLTNDMWTDLLVLNDRIGRPLHEEKLALTVKYIMAIRQGDYKTARECVERYVEIRDLINKRWLRLAIDYHEGRIKEGSQDYEIAIQLADKVWNENNKLYKKYERARDLYKEHGAKLMDISLYTLDPIHSLVEKALAEGIAIFPLGAGGPSTVCMAMSEKGADHITKFLETNGIPEFTDEAMTEAMEGAGKNELKGYMKFKMGLDPMKISGFDKLNLDFPEKPQRVSARKRDITKKTPVEQEIALLKIEKTKSKYDL